MSGKVKRAAAKTNTIINFSDSDNLEVPNYQGSVNLIQNPSFEQGLNYYQYRSYAKTPGIRYSWYYKLDNRTAKFGKNLHADAGIKANKRPGPVGHIYHAGLKPIKITRSVFTLSPTIVMPGWF